MSRYVMILNTDPHAEEEGIRQRYKCVHKQVMHRGQTDRGREGHKENLTNREQGPGLNTPLNS